MPALLTSHEELRTRMEAAGISKDQIATVLKGLNPPPAQADAKPPPPCDQQDRFGKLRAPGPLQLAETPTSEALRRGRQTFKVHFVTSAENKKTCQKIVLDGLPKSQAVWTVEFLQKTGFSKEPNLRMFRQKDNGERGHQICECVFHHRVNQNVEIKHPWYTWPEGWNPNTEVWSSDTGFLDETWMQWHYDLSDSRYPDRAVVVCKTVEKVGSDRTTNEPSVLEVCRVILNIDVTPAVIELPEALWKNATEEQMDEMMSNAMINYWRRQMGWWTKPSSGGGSRSTDTSGIASVTASVSSVC